MYGYEHGRSAAPRTTPWGLLFISLPQLVLHRRSPVQGQFNGATLLRARGPRGNSPRRMSLLAPSVAAYVIRRTRTCKRAVVSTLLKRSSMAARCSPSRSSRLLSFGDAEAAPDSPILQFGEQCSASYAPRRHRRSWFGMVAPTSHCRDWMLPTGGFAASRSRRAGSWTSRSITERELSGWEH